MAVLVVYEADAVADQLAVEGLRPGKIHAGPREILVQVHAGGHAGGEDILGLAGKAQAPEAGDVVCPGAGGIVGQIDVFFPEPGEALHQGDGTVIDLVAEVERAVHVEEEELAGFQFRIIHRSLSRQSVWSCGQG